MPRLYMIFAAFVFGGAILGPFGTFEALSLSQRVGFSVITNTVCWTIGIAITVPVRTFLEQRGVPRGLAIIIGSSFANALLFPIFIQMLQLELGVEIPLARIIEGLALVWFLVTFLTFGFLTVTTESIAGAEDSPTRSVPENSRPGKTDTSVPPSRANEATASGDSGPCHAYPTKCLLQKKLPREKQGMLYAMVAQDHYVEVITENGATLVLSRLSDAIDTCDKEDCLRVHRSAWVTMQGVDRVEKTGRNMQIILRNGRAVPVARSSEHLVRAMFGDPAKQQSGISSQPAYSS